MAPYYEEVCKELNWKPDAALLKKMKDVNAEELKKLDATLEDAEQNLGETEVRDAFLRKAEHLCRIGEKVGLLHCIVPFLQENNWGIN